MSDAARSGLRWWPLGVAALVLDQLTKEWILSTFALHESHYVLPVFDIVHARNYGAAFSFLDIPGGLQRWGFTAFAVVVSAGLLWWIRKLDARTQRLQVTGLMLIASGALGNVIDRIRHGNVVDFIALHWRDAYFPAFNVADSCITIGAILVLLDALLDSRRARAASGGAG
ncbi:MAG TPA: signal peptidase II, partial [Steroidobacteraceae bacterium]|nr:signal peptidase II [Steroidobacteraceae bacterium]